MRHIHSCQDCILRGHNLSGPRVLMNETDRVVDGEQEITSLKAQNLWCQTRVCVRIPLPTGSAAERKAATNCLNELKSNTKQEEKEEARAHLDLRSTMVVASSTSPRPPSRPRPDVSSVIARHLPSCTLRMCFTLATKTVAFLISYLDTSGDQKFSQKNPRVRE